MQDQENSEIEFTDSEGGSEIFSGKSANLSSYIPKDVSEALESFLGGIDRFTCYVYRKTPEGQALCLKVENSVPDPDEIGQVHGGGKYRYVFKVQPKTGKGRPAMRDAWVQLSDAYDEAAAIGRRKRLFEVQAPPQAPANGAGAFAFAERMLERFGPRQESASGGNTELFRLMMEMQDKAAERMEKMIERSERNTKELIQSIAGNKNSLSEMRETVLMLKEIGGVFGGGESKSVLGEILEHVAPVAAAAVSALGGRRAPAQIPQKPVEEDETEMQLEAITDEIISRIDELLTAATTGLAIKRKLVISKMKSSPEFALLLESPSHIAKIRAAIGEEKANKLSEIFGIH